LRAAVRRGTVFRVDDAVIEREEVIALPFNVSDIVVRFGTSKP
jgi:hypothetical protein